MARSKYINTFDTTADYESYIESALPAFPNIGYDKQADKVNIVRTSPNSHVWYGEVVDASQAVPTISINNVVNTPTLDTLTNMFCLDSWTSNVPTFISFNNKSNLKSIKKCNIDTSNVTYMNNMFDGCSLLTSLDLSSFNTSNVVNMNVMFNGCSSLTSLDLSSFNTSNVTNMAGMFQGCSSLVSLDLSNWGTSNVTYMNHMFNGCSSLTSLYLSNWDTSNVISVISMFNGCSSLTDVYITVEATLMKLTNNLASQGSTYIPSNNGNCTIHYNDVDYKWQNNAWTPQS